MSTRLSRGGGGAHTTQWPAVEASEEGARRRPLIDFVMMETHSPFYCPILASIPSSPLHRKRTKKEEQHFGVGVCLSVSLYIYLCVFIVSV